MPDPSTAAAPSLKQLAFGDLAFELAATRRLLERVPEDRFAWKPHAKSWSLGSLVLHIANLLNWQTAMLEENGFDLAAAPPPLSGVPESREALLRLFDANAERLRTALDRTDDAALGEAWTLRSGSRTLMTQPRAGALRSAGLSHLIHHRGQLSVYLRLLDVPLPPIYGPTADEAA